ncbi:MAG: FtsB family cell division protein [Ignavibacteria bacterium]
MHTEKPEKNYKGPITKIARYFKYNKISFIFFLIILTVLIGGIFNSKGLITRIKLTKVKNELEQQRNAEQKRTDQLQQEIEQLKTSDKKIEEIARDKYGMYRDGEKVYKIIVDSTK